MTTDHARYQDEVSRFFLSPQARYEDAGCLFCGKIKGYPIFTSIWRCQCGMVFNANQPTQETLDRFYAESDAMSSWASLKQSHHESKRQHSKFKRTVDYLAMHSKSILDIGCGTGKFLSMLKAKDPALVLKGIDSNEASLEVARASKLWVEKQGIPEFLSENRAKWDAVTLWGVLEHLKKPKETLLELKKHLSAHGHLVICVPNVDSLVVQTLWEKCFTFCPQHLWYFSLHTLWRLLEECGFEPKYHYTIEPELDPILKAQHGFKPYEPWPDWAEKLYGIEEDSLLRENREREILNAGKGYKIVMIAELQDDSEVAAA